MSETWFFQVAISEGYNDFLYQKNSTPPGGQQLQAVVSSPTNFITQPTYHMTSVPIVLASLGLLCSTTAPIQKYSFLPPFRPRDLPGAASNISENPKLAALIFPVFTHFLLLVCLPAVALSRKSQTQQAICPRMNSVNSTAQGSLHDRIHRQETCRASENRCLGRRFGPLFCHQFAIFVNTRWYSRPLLGTSLTFWATSPPLATPTT